MKNQIIKIVLGSFIVFCFFNTAHAATLNIETSVDVPANCTTTDTDGVNHNYGQVGSYLAVCALSAAMQAGTVSNVQLSNQYPSLGLFVTSIGSVTADPSSQYWAIYQNGNYASDGITLLPVVTGDTIKFQLHDFSDNDLGDQVIIHINSLVIPPTGSGPVIESTTDTSNNTPLTGLIALTPQTTSVTVIKPTFDIKKASDFLIAQQKGDGSFGEDLYTDWATLALVSGNYQDQILKLVKYLENNEVDGTNLTDYERHAMTLMALGLNPYETNNENYIEKIVYGFDGKQFGDPTEDNDDIFALIVLQNAGYTQDAKMINDDISFVLGRQKDDGSWDNSVDVTGAAIEALSTFSKNMWVETALSKAENFLRQKQKDDGGWNENASSTAWAIEGILALNEKPSDWISYGNTPLDYLATLQDDDGGIQDANIQTKIWETSYVVSALSGKTWNQIMQNYPLQETRTSTEINKPVPVTSTITPTPPEIISTVNNTVAVNTYHKKNNAPNTENQNLKKKMEIPPNTASVINAINTTTTPDTTTINQTEPVKENWFMKLFHNIFG